MDKLQKDTLGCINNSLSEDKFKNKYKYILQNLHTEEQIIYSSYLNKLKKDLKQDDRFIQYIESHFNKYIFIS